MLRQRFGPQYDRVVKKEVDVRRGEEVLAFRAERREKLEIRPISSSRRAEFASRWENVQSLFVDDPTGAVSRADELVNGVMLARGYPVGDFDQRAADISVDHPIVVDNYRTGHEIAVRRWTRGVGNAAPGRSFAEERSKLERSTGIEWTKVSTEDLRVASALSFILPPLTVCPGTLIDGVNRTGTSMHGFDLDPLRWREMNR
jgi:hypothetical protein